MATATASYPSVSVNDLRLIIATTGHITTPYITGEPGIAKSSLLPAVMEMLDPNEYEPIYADCGSLNYGDVGSYIPVHDSKQLEFYVSALFKLDSPKKKVIMLDEFGKLPKVLRPTLTRLILERMVGDRALAEGSIVFATSNSASDGVGDFLAAHEGNRISVYKMAKPRAIDDQGRPAEWLVWASNNGISPVTMSFAAMTPAAFQSYEDDKDGRNPMIFNPRTNPVTFLSPRSLAKADKAYVQNRQVLGERLLHASLCGSIGVAGANALATFISMEKDLVSTHDVIKDPEGVAMPSNLGARYMMLFNAVNAIVTQDDLTAYMKFVTRMNSSELEAVFFTLLAGNGKTAHLARTNDTIKNWMKNNYVLI
jgi:hypothetical protein